MKLFSGFPPGKLQVTPIPNLFFSELCPSIDDLAELKLTLHLFFMLGQRAKSPRAGERAKRVSYVSASELRADLTLMRSLAVSGDSGDETLARAIAAAVGRGTLLHLDVARRDKTRESLFFLNSEAGRREYEKIARQAEPPEVEPAGEPAVGSARPNIFTLYEQNIGILTPLISDELKEAEQQYPPDWIPDAFRLAVENNKRSWSYIRKILERWQTEGRSGRLKKGKPWYGDEYSKFVKR